MNYRAKAMGFPKCIVKAEQFIPGKPMPEGMKRWPDDNNISGVDGSFGYINTPTPVGWHAVYSEDWIVFDGTNYHVLSDAVFKDIYEPVTSITYTATVPSNTTVEVKHGEKSLPLVVKERSMGDLPKHLSYFGAYGIVIEEAITCTMDFMLRLLNSGVDPASVSLEGFRYAYALVKDGRTYSEETILYDMASYLSERAATRAGISSDQLRAKREGRG